MHKMLVDQTQCCIKVLRIKKMKKSSWPLSLCLSPVSALPWGIK